MQDEIVTPQHISRKAFYTIPLFGLTSLVSFHYGLTSLSLVSFNVMLTSFAHWNLLKKEGIERNLDRVMSVLTYTSLWLESRNFSPEYRKWWSLLTIFNTGVYITNQYVFYSIYKSTTDPVIREKNNYRSTYIHMFFIHVLPNVSCIYGILTSHRASVTK